MKICWRMFDWIKKRKISRSINNNLWLIDFFLCLRRRRDGIFMSFSVNFVLFWINQCSTSVGLNEWRTNNRIAVGFLLMMMFLRKTCRFWTRRKFPLIISFDSLCIKWKLFDWEKNQYTLTRFCERFSSYEFVSEIAFTSDTIDSLVRRRWKKQVDR